MKKVILIVTICICICCAILLLSSCRATAIQDSDSSTNSTEASIYHYLKIYNTQTNKVYIEWSGNDIEYEIIDDCYLEAYNYNADGSFEYCCIYLSENIQYTVIRKN